MDRITYIAIFFSLIGLVVNDLFEKYKIYAGSVLLCMLFLFIWYISHAIKDYRICKIYLEIIEKQKKNETLEEVKEIKKFLGM